MYELLEGFACTYLLVEIVSHCELQQPNEVGLNSGMCASAIRLVLPVCKYNSKIDGQVMD